MKKRVNRINNSNGVSNVGDFNSKSIVEKDSAYNSIKKEAKLLYSNTLKVPGQEDSPHYDSLIPHSPWIPSSERIDSSQRRWRKRTKSQNWANKGKLDLLTNN